MQTKPKSNSVITHEFREENGELAFLVNGAGETVLPLDRLSTQVRHRAMLHGLIQRISDAAAMSRDPATGRAASPQDKLAAMKSLVDHYASGTLDWGRKREGGGAQEGGLLISVLIRAYPEKPLVELQKFAKARSVVERNALLASEKLKPIADAIRAERAPGGVDVDGLLGGLELAE